MNLIETFALDASTVRIIGIGVLSALLLMSVSLNVWTLRRIRSLESRQRDIIQRAGRRSGQRDLATAAVAAAVLTSQGQNVQWRDVEAEVDSLLENWDRIEDMADEVSRKLDEAVKTGDLD